MYLIIDLIYFRMESKKMKIVYPDCWNVFCFQTRTIFYKLDIFGVVQFKSDESSMHQRIVEKRNKNRDLQILPREARTGQRPVRKVML